MSSPSSWLHWYEYYVTGPVTSLPSRRSGSGHGHSPLGLSYGLQGPLLVYTTTTDRPHSLGCEWSGVPSVDT
jgi:hypothetical protein